MRHRFKKYIGGSVDKTGIDKSKLDAIIETDDKSKADDTSKSTFVPLPQIDWDDDTSSGTDTSSGADTSSGTDTSSGADTSSVADTSSGADTSSVADINKLISYTKKEKVKSCSVWIWCCIIMSILFLFKTNTSNVIQRFVCNIREDGVKECNEIFDNFEQL